MLTVLYLPELPRDRGLPELWRLLLLRPPSGRPNVRLQFGSGRLSARQVQGVERTHSGRAGPRAHLQQLRDVRLIISILFRALKTRD